MERNDYRKFVMTNQEIENPFDLLLNYPSQHKLLSWLHKNCGNWNSVLGLQTKIAKDIGFTKVTVCNSIKELEKKELIIKDGKEGTTNRYMVNPHWIWKGEAKDHRLGIAKWDRAMQRKAEEEKESDF